MERQGTGRSVNVLLRPPIRDGGWSAGRGAATLAGGRLPAYFLHPGLVPRPSSSEELARVHTHKKVLIILLWWLEKTRDLDGGDVGEVNELC